MNKILAPFAFFARPLTRALRSDVYKEAHTLAGTIQDLGREAVEGWRPRDVRHETFLNAVARHKWSNADLVTLYKQSAGLALMFAVAGTMSLGWLLASLVKGDLFAVLPCLGAVAFFGAQFLARSFRAHQIARRELMTFGEFFGTPSAWVPCYPLASIASGVAHE